MLKKILLLLSLYPVSLLASNNIVERGALFSEKEKSYDQYQLITGEILFQKRNSETHTKGFRPVSHKSIGGKVVKKVYDFAPDSSPSMLFNEYRSYLAKRGYEFVFTCRGLDCGPLPGWKLFLSDAIGGSPTNQYYAAAIRKFDASKKRKHVALYLSEIDGQPRLVLHEITGSKAAARFKSFPASQLQDNDDLGLMHEVFFETGVYGEFSDENFERLVESVKQLSETEELVLVGFADPEGNASSNYNLAKQRAAQVRKVLVEKHSINGNRITVLSGGELKLPKASNQNRLSRKVSVYRFDNEDS